ncbi:hypothetical protein ONZ51_g7375 [Trametes cubensis]|uniref:Uncharacterized protein n=1 Tax=Trametes cubensis TaxID=1111947 RepID=A0AAD7TSU7_9APHY|nr:hypothetical protein ONZ51_g7375 [Trametes cubensis]
MSSSTTNNPQDGHDDEEEVDELIDDDAPDTTRHDLQSTALAPTSSKPTRPNAHRLIQMSVECDHCRAHSRAQKSAKGKKEGGIIARFNGIGFGIVKNHTHNWPAIFELVEHATKFLAIHGVTILDASALESRTADCYSPWTTPTERPFPVRGFLLERFGDRFGALRDTVIRTAIIDTPAAAQVTIKSQSEDLGRDNAEQQPSQSQTYDFPDIPADDGEQPKPEVPYIELRGYARAQARSRLQSATRSHTCPTDSDHAPTQTSTLHTQNVDGLVDPLSEQAPGSGEAIPASPMDVDPPVPKVVLPRSEPPSLPGVANAGVGASVNLLNELAVIQAEESQFRSRRAVIDMYLASLDARKAQLLAALSGQAQ